MCKLSGSKSKGVYAHGLIREPYFWDKDPEGMDIQL